MIDKTKHWKDFFESGSTLQDNCFDGKNDTIVTIRDMDHINLKTADGEKPYLCAMLEGYELPLRLNKTMSKAMVKATKQNNPGHWVGATIAIYIDHKVRDPQNGGFCAVPRIRSFAPRVQVDLEPAKLSIGVCRNLDELNAAYKKQPIAVQKSPQIIGICKKMKQDFLAQEND